MKVVGFSIVSDMCLPDALEEASHIRILQAAKKAEPNLTAIVKGVLRKL